MRTPVARAVTAFFLGVTLVLTGLPLATAQTATKLNCKGCVTSKQIKNKSLKNKDFEKDQFRSSHIRDGTIEYVDLSDALAGKLTPTDSVVKDGDGDVIGPFVPYNVSGVLMRVSGDESADGAEAREFDAAEYHVATVTRDLISGSAVYYENVNCTGATAVGGESSFNIIPVVGIGTDPANGNAGAFYRIVDPSVTVMNFEYKAASGQDPNGTVFCSPNPGTQTLSVALPASPARPVADFPPPYSIDTIE